jgi:hypothetical protein
LQPAAVWHSGLEQVIIFLRPHVRFEGSDGRRSRQSPLHRLNPVHVSCKKLAPAFASMDDKRMLHPFRALAPDLK